MAKPPQIKRELPNRSVKSRFGISIASNVVRGAVTFVTGLAVARALGPEDYGSFAFLIGSFSAIKQLLDCGSSSAFYTFISQRPRGRAFFASYAAWLALQFALPLAAIALILPEQVVAVLWVNHDRNIVLFAFIAVFMQQQAWQTMMQVGESMRRTAFVQVLSLGLALLHLAIVLVLWQTRLLSVSLLFILTIAEYLGATSIAIRVLLKPGPEAPEAFSWSATLREYRAYCVPLILYSWVGFANGYIENWLLQLFGGSVEQAYFAVGSQFSAGCRLATSAMLHIFWKEIAEAHKSGDLVRVEYLYRRVSRFLFMVSAAISALLVPWSAQIAGAILGPSFVAGASVLAVMLLYPLHASLGQIVGTMYLATGRNTPQVVIGIVSMALSIPLAYFLLAPSDLALPGLALGGMGMAIKMLVTTVATTNVMAWWLAKQYRWRFSWQHQFVATAACLALGWLSWRAALLAGDLLRLNLLTEFVLGAIAYALMLALYLWLHPAIMGLEREELQTYVRRLLKRRDAPA